jgi:ParB family chromosome partitioning protein
LASAELLSDYLDTRVSIEQGKGKGKITIEFAGSEDLQRIVDLIEG